MPQGNKGPPFYGYRPRNDPGFWLVTLASLALAFWLFDPWGALFP